MNKLWLMLLCLVATHANAAINQASAIAARNEAIAAMQGFKPMDVIPGFTVDPVETQFRPTDVPGGDSRLVNEGSNRAKTDEAARFVIQQKGLRATITPNPKASEIDYAERLLDNADTANQSACYMEPVPCEEHRVEKRCEESVKYSPLSCRDHLNVTLRPLRHPDIKRLVTSASSGSSVTWVTDLTSCMKSTSKGMFCEHQQELTFHPNCEYISVQVILGGQTLAVTKAPTCSDPTLTVTMAPNIAMATFHVTEFLHDDQWTHSDCTRLNDATPDRHCVPASVNACLDENATKLIDGIPVTRHCWGMEQTYSCADGVNSSCTPLLDQGCSNTASVCTRFSNEQCEATSKTFQCTEKTCFPDKEVCPDVVGCTDGSCDTTVASESNDINEGLSRLGTLAGTAEDAAANQTHLGQGSIFKGDAQECEKYPWGIRDCCTDSGFLEGLLNCPAKLQVLQRAKVENRVVSLGHYKHHILGTTHHVYCVFPTKLAGIVQIQGRGAQLHVPFGSPEKPDCRGLTPEQLEGLDFKRLDISPLVADITGRKSLPSDASVDGVNTTHVEALHDKGVSHD